MGRNVAACAARAQHHDLYWAGQREFVDNNRSRQLCHRVFCQAKELIYIDSGNGEYTGQVVCGGENSFASTVALTPHSSSCVSFVVPAAH